MAKTAFICSEDLWQSGHGPSHPLKPERLERTYHLLNAYHLFDGDRSRLIPARMPADEELCLFHTEEYVAAVRALSRGEADFNPARYNFGPGDNPIFESMFETEGLKVGAALVAAELVTSGEVDITFSFSGGLHHAAPARASGFCVFNDAAVAIHSLLARDLRVAYIDIDAHHGDGVQAAFYDSDRVLTISLHETGLYLFPGTGFVNEVGAGAGRGYAVNLPLPPYTGDQIYLWAFREVVPPLVEAFEPDVVVSQLGIDTHYLDPLTHLMLTTEGYGAVVEIIKGLAPRWLALGGGGYNVEVVPRAWTLAYGVMLGLDLPDELPPAYAERYGPGTLRDHEKPHISPDVAAQVQRQTEHAAEDLKRALAQARGADVQPG
jgi:acetoin utilization protein AcuC